MKRKKEKKKERKNLLASEFSIPADHRIKSREWPEGSLFNSYHTEV